LRIAAAMLGWRLHVLPQWADTQIAALLGLDRLAEYDGAEIEDAECIALVGRDPGPGIRDPDPLVRAARDGSWFGRANRLSPDRVDWPIMDEVTAATRYPGSGQPRAGMRHEEPGTRRPRIADPGSQTYAANARNIVIQRRSALAFNPRGALQRDAFFSMLDRLQPGAPPWDAIHWPPHVHLVLFVHRVDDVRPGVYAYLRERGIHDEWKAAMRPEFLWEPVPFRGGEPTMYLLVPIEVSATANRLSCDQDIAGDGFFSLAMIARFEQPLRERGDWFYRRLFWECGLLGQVLYLEAEAAGGRATGIGCYYDDPVHDLLGLSGHAWQDLYHFSMGLPVEDPRLTSEPGYAWEPRA
jgi:hypothetical protein